jgi:mediator of RNA polymerase II transcription subunit 27
MSEGINLEAVSSSLKAVKTLRSSVRDLFKLLSEGEVREQANNVKSELNQDPFLTEVKSVIENISTRLRELESSCTLIAHPSVSMNINLGNTGMLSQDPAFERTNLYSSLIASYRWNDKLQEYASHAYTILTANTLKRSHLGM